MISQTDLSTFVETDFSNGQNYDWDNRSFVSHMSDVWGEANRTILCYNIWKDEQSAAAHEKMMSQISFFHDVCSMIHANSTIVEDGKFELKTAQWELYDFILWGNTLGNNDKTVMRWFDQWMYSIKR